jgi:hypothetical protein
MVSAKYLLYSVFLCASHISDNFDNEVTTAGWGCTEYSFTNVHIQKPTIQGNVEFGLHKLTYHLLTQETCSNFTRAKDGILCAQTRDDTNKGSCQGDSGGPLICTRKYDLSRVGAPILCGVNSHRNVSAKVDVFMKVISFLPWIKERGYGSEETPLEEGWIVIVVVVVAIGLAAIFIILLVLGRSCWPNISRRLRDWHYNRMCISSSGGPIETQETESFREMQVFHVSKDFESNSDSLSPSA